MTTLVYVILILSIFLNALLYWYIRELLKQFRLGATSGNVVVKSLKDYQAHLQGVYELESYYGDTTIGGLLQHTSDLLEDVKEYGNFFFSEQKIEENEERDE